MLTGGTARACCSGATVSSALCFTNVPGSTVALVGGTTSFVRFSYPWGGGFVVTDAVSGTIPCKPGVDEKIVLGFALGLV